MLSAGQVDAVTGFSYLSGVNLRIAAFRRRSGGAALRRLWLRGLRVSVIVNPAFAAAKPEAVRGFLRAVIAAPIWPSRTPGAG